MPLPTLTYYCDYLPSICLNIRDSKFLTNDEVILTYDPFSNKGRRTSVCTNVERAAMKAAGGCAPRQHDPRYWNVGMVGFYDI